jgi:hypothetical protein
MSFEIPSTTTKLVSIFNPMNLRIQKVNQLKRNHN